MGILSITKEGQGVSSNSMNAAPQIQLDPRDNPFLYYWMELGKHKSKPDDIVIFFQNLSSSFKIFPRKIKDNSYLEKLKNLNDDAIEEFFSALWKTCSSVQ